VLSFQANKWNGTLAEKVQETGTQPFDVKVYHPGRQPALDLTNPLYKDSCGSNNGGCSHICLRVSASQRKCVCPHLMKLGGDGVTCTGEPSLST